jgi:hypothetical protein
MVIHFRQENAIFWYILYYFGGRFFFISSNVLRNIENGFWTQFLLHNSCYLSNDSVFSKNLYVFTHLHLFKWKNSSRCFLWNHMSGTLHIELKWDSELICNIWLSTSLSLVIVWMVFEVYLHFAVYWYNYNFFTNIFFNHLILTSKWDFFRIIFFGFWTTLFQVLFAKDRFNVSLVEVQKHLVSKSSICDNNIWPL